MRRLILDSIAITAYTIVLAFLIQAAIVSEENQETLARIKATQIKHSVIYHVEQWLGDKRR